MKKGGEENHRAVKRDLLACSSDVVPLLSNQSPSLPLGVYELWPGGHLLHPLSPHSSQLARPAPQEGRGELSRLLLD